VPGVSRVDGPWRRQVEQDTKEVWLQVCQMTLHFVQGRGLGLGGVLGGPCCVPKGRRQPQGWRQVCGGSISVAYVLVPLGHVLGWDVTFGP
jgi:hypothetical protein